MRGQILPRVLEAISETLLMNIVLIGYRGSGKSTVGGRLAAHLGMRFVDIDHLIEERHGARISDMVKSHGWDHFRAIEKRVIKEISRLDHLIIAPGGGAVLDVNNIMALRRRGIMIWLKASPEVLIKRIDNDPHTIHQRPPLTQKESFEEIEEVLTYRGPFYEWASEIQIDTSTLKIEEVAGKILSTIWERIQGG